VDGDELVDDGSAAEKVEFRLRGTCADWKGGRRNRRVREGRGGRKFWGQEGELRYEPTGRKRGEQVSIDQVEWVDGERSRTCLNHLD